MITLEDVRVVFGRTIALDGVSAEIAPGITGLFGPNGAGKSTLLRIIAGLIKPTSGVASIDGRAVSLGDERLRRRVGFASHDSGLYARLSLAENLDLFSSLYGVAPARAPALLERLGLVGFADVPVGALSAGLKRRAAVARALLHDPDVLLLDEPYANVDEDATQTISEAIVDWHRPDRVAVVATHGGKKVKAYAHAGLILKQGRVVVHGRYDRRAAAERSS